MTAIRDRLVLIVALIAAWQLVTATGLISPIFLASPLEVGKALVVSGQDGSLAASVASTLLRAITGFSIGAFVGIILGILLGYFDRAYRAFAWFIDFIRSVPITALLPLFVLLLGIGDRAQVAAIAWAAGLLLLVHTTLGVRSVLPGRIQVARAFRANPRQVLWHVILPDSLPNIFIGLRTAVSYALVVAIVAEMLLSGTPGLGRSIYQASQVNATDRVYAGILMVGLVGYVVNRLLERVDRVLVHWRGQ